MGSSSCLVVCAFAWRIIPKAFRIKTSWESWNYQLEATHREMRRLEHMLQDHISLERTASNALALTTIQEVLHVRSCQRLQCEAILWEIGKARVANTGLAVLCDQSSSRVTRRENYLQLLDEHMGKGYTLVRTWEHEEDRRIQDVLTKVQESLKS